LNSQEASQDLNSQEASQDSNSQEAPEEEMGSQMEGGLEPALGERSESRSRQDHDEIRHKGRWEGEGASRQLLQQQPPMMQFVMLGRGQPWIEESLR
jgi:hypothetical protein